MTVLCSKIPVELILTVQCRLTFDSNYNYTMFRELNNKIKMIDGELYKN